MDRQIHLAEQFFDLGHIERSSRLGNGIRLPGGPDSFDRRGFLRVEQVSEFPEIFGAHFGPRLNPAVRGFRKQA